MPNCETRHPAEDFVHTRIDLSVVVPVYGCVMSLIALHHRLTASLSLLNIEYEIVFIDDRAEDGAWDIMCQFAQTDRHFVACRMSRNVGQQLAITAGLEQCRGAYAIVMDCDLQDPPEIIGTLLEKARAGADIVYARRKTDYQAPTRMIFNRVYFRLLGLISGQQTDGDLGSFSCISRRVIDAFLKFRERDRHYLMILRQLGYNTASIDYARAERELSQSSYTLGKLIAHAMSGLFFTTTRLLHWVIYMGFSIAALGIFTALVVTLRWFIAGAAPGWTSLIVLQLILGGVITLSVGITGLYVGKIFEASQNRPLFFIQDRLSGAQIPRMQASSQTKGT